VKVLITGAGGQVAAALVATQPPETVAVALGRDELDITDPDAVTRNLSRYGPDVLINAAAYTAVDKAESNADLAYRVNAEGAANLAEGARGCGARFLHLSTDFVFDGTQSHPYTPGDVTHPLGVYAASKLQGEQRVHDILGEQALILRTAWVYAARGSNFARTILRLAGERDSLSVVADQVGSPTWANSIAEVLWTAVRHPAFTGTHHWTDAGVASWYDFAVAIVEEASPLGLLSRPVEVLSIPTSAYPTPARRPAYSVLDRSSTEQALGIRAGHWRTNLRKMLLELRNA
jgi:dTDP-4-dehydrorhamnose reductase